MTTSKYTVFNKDSGLVLGIYIATTPVNALKQLARQAGDKDMLRQLNAGHAWTCATEGGMRAELFGTGLEARPVAK